MVAWIDPRRAALLVSAAVILVAGCATTDDRVAGCLGMIEDIVYETRDGEELRLDMVLPAGPDDARAALVFLHGGGFMEGSKADFAAALRTAAERGYVAISVQYRLTKPSTAEGPHNQFPAALHDVKSAIRWVRTHAEIYGVDPGRIGVVGFSAGAALALLAAVVEPADGLEGPDAPYEVSSTVQAVVAAAPPVDLTDPGVNWLSFALRAHDQYLGGSLEDVPDRYAQASPVTYFDRRDAPSLVIFGGRDLHMPWSQVERFALAVVERRAVHQMLYLPAASHDAHMLLNLWEDHPVWSFLELHLREEETGHR